MGTEKLVKFAAVVYSYFSHLTIRFQLYIFTHHVVALYHGITGSLPIFSTNVISSEMLNLLHFIWSIDLAKPLTKKLVA